MHCGRKTEPSCSVTVLAGHWVQFSAAIMPCTPEYVDRGQRLQTVLPCALWYLPAAHREQFFASEMKPDPVAKVPALQARHWVEVGTPIPDEYLPWSHIEHAADEVCMPTPVENVPA